MQHGRKPPHNMTTLRNIPTRRARLRRALILQAALWLALDLLLLAYLLA